jgi:hypothetical protein
MQNTFRNGLLSTVALLLFAPVSARADQPGKHPAYLHALTDLRTARWELKKRGGDPQMKWDERTAIDEVEKAINEIKQASIDDGKDLEDHPKEDAGKLPRGARLHSALKLLETAHKDIKEKEDNSFAQGLQGRALKHIDEAINFTKQGISNAEHP